MHRSVWGLSLFAFGVACGGAKSARSPMAAGPAAAGRTIVGRISGSASQPDDAPAETWKRSELVPNTARVMIGDTEQLALRSMQTRVAIDGFRARVVIDYVYANDSDRGYEGTFQLRLPEEATPFFFAFGETRFAARDPQLPTLTIATSPDDALDPQALVQQRQGAWLAPKEARMVPREDAVVAYTQTVQRRVDPALMEWAGAGVFTARVFPLAAHKLHRIVVGYDVDLVRIADDLEYRFDLPEHVPASVVDVTVTGAATVTTTPAREARVDGGRQSFLFTGTQDRTIAVRLRRPGALALVGDDPVGTLFAAQAIPALPTVATAAADHATFLLDTSLSSNPDRFNVWTKLLRAVLERNRDTIKYFDVLVWSVDAHWYRPSPTANTPAAVDELLAYVDTLALEGATDLGAALAAARPRITPGTDVFLLSDGAATWGESDLHALGKLVRGGGSLFAYQTGLAGTDVPTLAHLARETGGAVFSVTGEAELERVATAHRARPWRLEHVEITGARASDVMLAGRPSTLFPGQTVLAVGRGDLGPDAALALTVRQGNRREVVTTKLAAPIRSTLAARAYGQVATARLEELGARDLHAVAKAYATHFRITGKTCSLLMLETEADYARFGIRPEDDVRTITSAPADPLFERTLQETYDTLGDPRAAFVAMLDRLEASMALRPADGAVRFKATPAYRALIAQLPDAVFAVPSAPLSTQLRTRQQAGTLPKDLDYDAVSAIAQRRMRTSTGDALKALSSLVEQNPGDSVLARDVGYSALELGQREQAYHLFRRVAEARPHEPQTYHAIARALAAMGNPDLALAYYEIPLMGEWDPKFGELHTIVELDYARFLRKLARDRTQLHAGDYARTRLASLSRSIGMDRADVVVTITWNTDNTDVDLHVIEPSGEECFYSHPKTRSGGRLTRDVTQGYGPEMYVLRDAPRGTYEIKTHYYASDRNRASARSKVHVTIVENYGTPAEKVTEQVVVLRGDKELQPIATLYRR